MKFIPFALSALTGVLLVLIFPTFDIEILAWVAFVPLFFSFRGQGLKGSFIAGFIAGVVANCGILYWTTVAMSVYGRIPWALSGVILLLLAGILSALYFGPWAAAVEYLSGKGIMETLSAPVIWTSLEFIRNYLFTGFPWENLGYSQYLNLHLIQMSEYTGVYGVSFVVMLANASIYSLLEGILMEGRSVQFKKWVGAVISACLILGICAFGHRRLADVRNASASAPRLKVGLVQGNIDQDRKWNPAFQEETMNIYIGLTRSLASEKPGLIIWPETAVPFYFQSDHRYRPQVFSISRELNSFVLVGSVAYGFVRSELDYFNSAYLISPEGKETGRYDKIHMVPFGEYLPFPFSLLYSFLGKVIGAVGDFTPGEKSYVFLIPQGGFGVLICYEIIFPELSRRLALDGANLLVTITNDAWFGRTSAPYQHLSMATFRAVENRRFIARAANTGISGFVDITGKIMLTTDIFKPAYLSGEVGLEKYLTFYTYYGDVFSWACLLVSAILFWRTFGRLKFPLLRHKIKVLWQ